eukprot:CAMPEP_0118957042 /NCGR_PEP_ID=MMETSP1169-20130426/61893_1 /TAXON_ID=36882 /ORGANISM="Pyramimonas obovata, Strain CCMP722" /LENGTH=601 /DNA_ID=CAMNT_0006905097 /DNA_START=269 /DNA_END=2075 /DNA_ORIENTATION=-
MASHRDRQGVGVRVVESPRRSEGVIEAEAEAEAEVAAVVGRAMIGAAIQTLTKEGGTLTEEGVTLAKEEVRPEEEKERVKRESSRERHRSSHGKSRSVHHGSAEKSIEGRNNIDLSSPKEDSTPKKDSAPEEDSAHKEDLAPKEGSCEDPKDETHDIQAKSGRRSTKKSKTTAKPSKLLSFGDEMEEDDGSNIKLSIGETTTKRFREAPPPQTMMPAIGLEVLSNVNRSFGGGLALPSSGTKPSSTGRCLAALRIGAAQTRGYRPYMEDRHTIVTSFLPEATAADGVPRSYFGLFDGHNGARAAEMAAHRLHKILGDDRQFRNSGDSGADEQVVTGALKRSFLEVEREMLELFNSEGAGDGSTAVVVVRLGNALYSAHSGDSRAVLGLVGGRAVRLTEDHKPDRPDERARVEALGGSIEHNGMLAGGGTASQRPSEGARNEQIPRGPRFLGEVARPVNGLQKAARNEQIPRGPRFLGEVARPVNGLQKALAVSRSLGDRDFKSPVAVVEALPEVGRRELTPDAAFVIMASDGLWDVVSDEVAVETVQAELDNWQRRAPGMASTRASQAGVEKAAAEKLVADALALGSPDNITVIVILFPWE